MQFITNGPDIPEELLQAHEEGRVVFFCGTGISYPAGLPGFDGLVDEIYQLSGTESTDIEREALDRKQFDVALDLLEKRLPGQRQAVRDKLTQVLKPKWVPRELGQCLDAIDQVAPQFAHNTQYQRLRE